MPRPRTQAPPGPALPAETGAAAGLRLNERAERYLRGLVLDGPLAPGAPVPLEEIARHLGMSRQPLRDAAARLAADALLEIRPQVGCRVAKPAPRAAGDFFRMFAAVAGVTAALAAERRSPDQAASIGAEMRAIARAARARAPGPESHRTLNRRFHLAIHGCAGSPGVAALAESLWDRSDFYLRAAFGRITLTRPVLAAYTEIAARIAAGDTAAAARLMRGHLEELGAKVERALAPA
jgi:DNA-binding GntR family transcriptional regulator